MKKLTKNQRRAAYLVTLTDTQLQRIAKQIEKPANPISIRSIAVIVKQKGKLERRRLAKLAREYAAYRERRHNRRVRRARLEFEAAKYA